MIRKSWGEVYLGRSTRLWAAAGAAFGVCFPAMAVGIRVAHGGFWLAIQDLSQDPTLWIIGSAPIFLGIFAGLGGRQQDRVRRLNEGLETQVSERTAELATSLSSLADHSAEQSGLLESLEIGLARFGPDGTLSSARSAQLDRVLPGSSAETTIDGLLTRFSPVNADAVSFVRKLLWDPDFDSEFEDSVSLLETRFQHQGRTLQTKFSPIHDAHGALANVLLQVLDVTQAVQAQREHERSTARLERLSMAAGSPAGFRRFVADARQLFADCKQNSGPEERARAMHTIYGNARMFGFHEVAAMVHEAEDIIAAGGQPDPHRTSALFERQVDEAFEVLGLDPTGDLVPMSTKAVRRIAESASAPVAEALGKLTWTPIEAHLKAHLKAVRSLAEKRGVALSLEVVGPDLPPGALDPFADALGHLLTNAVTHGASDAPLTLRVEVVPGAQLRVTVQDDGVGIQTDTLVRKAVARGHWSVVQSETASREQALQLVFAPGLSARDQVDDAAGRGVGLDAVRSAMQAMGGSVTVRSEPGEGACFRLSGPGVRGLAA